MECNFLERKATARIVTAYKITEQLWFEGTSGNLKHSLLLKGRSATRSDVAQALLSWVLETAEDGAQRTSWFNLLHCLSVHHSSETLPYINSDPSCFRFST